MDSWFNETYLKYALGLCGLIFLIAVFKVFKRGKEALYLVGAIASFAVVLLALYQAWPMPVVYAAGFFCALLLVLDAMVRKPKGR